ncbi:copper homeostasis CutC domain-containing protein [Mycena floridula]|nr:copper homeostasis CutC domain-containing protein [Mycena floridula]
MSTIIIEVCVDSVESAVNATEAGANRLELCGNLALGGGTTPSLGLYKAVKRSVNVPIMVMIRPRCGDFLYSDAELDVMLEDILLFKDHSATGIVVGILTADGRVDVNRVKRVVEAAAGMEVCFHRAFDMTRDPIEAIRDIASIEGVSRILTSGQCPRAVDALKILKALFVEAANLDSCHLTVMPGSGINGATIEPILESLAPAGLRELHLSGGRWIQGDMSFRRRGLGMGINEDVEWSIWRTAVPLVREIRQTVDRT